MTDDDFDCEVGRCLEPGQPPCEHSRTFCADHLDHCRDCAREAEDAHEHILALRVVA